MSLLSLEELTNKALLQCSSNNGDFIYRDTPTNDASPPGAERCCILIANSANNLDVEVAEQASWADERNDENWLRYKLDDSRTETELDDEPCCHIYVNIKNALVKEDKNSKINIQAIKNKENNDLVLLEKKIQREIKDEEFVCDFDKCGKVFTKNWRLRRHRKRHETKSALCVCDICNKEYKFQEGLTRHKKVIHEKEYPYQCNFCEKSFAHRNSKLIHERKVHMDQFLYRCTVLSKRLAKI